MSEGLAIDIMCTEFGDDSSTRFPFKAQTHTHTQTNTKPLTQLIDLPPHRLINQSTGNVLQVKYYVLQVSYYLVMMRCRRLQSCSVGGETTVTGCDVPCSGSTFHHTHPTQPPHPAGTQAERLHPLITASNKAVVDSGFRTRHPNGYV